MTIVTVKVQFSAVVAFVGAGVGAGVDVITGAGVGVEVFESQYPLQVASMYPQE
jgi:hypothetical protein